MLTYLPLFFPHYLTDANLLVVDNYHCQFISIEERFSLDNTNTYILEEGRGKGIVKGCEENVGKLVKRLVRECNSTEAKDQETSGSKEWLTGSDTQDPVN